MNMTTIDLNKWIKGLPYWERLALDKILSGEELTEEDYQELLQCLLSGQSLSKQLPQKPLPHIDEFLKTTTATSRKMITLSKFHNFRNVNSLVDGQTITIGPQLTALFGPNRAGKSSYVRIIANAAFCRGVNDIIPDVTKPTSTTLSEMDVEVIDNNSTKTLHFTYGTGIPELSSVYVFNGQSAEIHLTKANSINFTPAQLSYFPILAEVTDNVRTKLSDKIKQISQDNLFIPHFPGDTAVSRIIKSLNAQTDIPTLTSLATLTDVEKSRAKEIRKRIADIRSEKLLEKINTIARAITVITQLATTIESSKKLIDDEFVCALNELITRYDKWLEIANKTSSDQFKSKQLLDVGGEAWKTLVNTGHEYGKHQHPGKEYPQTDDICLLCQQPLSSHSVDLIKKMWQFLQSEAPSHISTIQKQIDQTVRNLSAANFQFVGNQTSAHEHLEKHSPELLKEVETFSEACNNRRIIIQKGLSEHKKIVATGLPDDCIQKLQDLAVLLGEEKKKIAALNTADELSKLQKEELEIQHREELPKYLPEIEKFVRRLRWIAKASAIGGSTRHITDTHNALFGLLVTQQYIDTFNRTLSEFGRPLKVKVKSSSQKGETLRKIILETDQSVNPDTIPVSKVLSDGEKRVVALADFLSEIITDQNSGSIVIDDPVTSLDKDWKDAIAKRLVEESTKRQMIIFTHDLPFLALLKHFSHELGVDMKSHWITRGETDDTPGYVALDNSPISETDYCNTEPVRRLHAEAKDQPPQVQIEKLRTGFGKLRTGYEALFMHNFMKGTVVRYSERVSMDKLKSVVWDQQIIDEIIEANARLSRFIEGHSHSDEASTLPSRDDLLHECEAFEALKKRINVLRKP